MYTSPSIAYVNKCMHNLHQEQKYRLVEGLRAKQNLKNLVSTEHPLPTKCKTWGGSGVPLEMWGLVKGVQSHRPLL